MAKLGVKTVDELVGRTDFLEAREDVEEAEELQRLTFLIYLTIFMLRKLFN